LKQDSQALFSPTSVGGIQLSNRIVMSPMSRHRATLSGVPTDLMVEYYRQRASAGLVIAEGTYPSPMGKAYLFTPGLHNVEQLTSWRRVADAVHGAGGAIFTQLMHAGRISDPLLLDGETPVAPSAVQPAPEDYSSPWPRPKRPYMIPRALTHAEILKIIDEHVASAVLARQAGLDGVEIHGASGYLPMQFLSTNTNLRNDQWGGSVERRSAFLLALVDAMSSATSPGFVSVKLSPGWQFNQVDDIDPPSTYSYLVEALSRRGIAYLHIGNYGMNWDVFGTLRPFFDGTMIFAAGFNRASGANAIKAAGANLVAFGQAFISNPDLVTRFRDDRGINRPQLVTYYTQGADGYIDYPTFAGSDREQQVSADGPLPPLTGLPKTSPIRQQNASSMTGRCAPDVDE
jgi:N-ethylmaleimide reductase